MKKKIIFFAIVHFLPYLTIQSQNMNQNYVSTTVYLSGGDSIVSVQYYDGIGRPTQMVTGGTNASGIYLHSLKEYDNMGRESKSWLPLLGGQTPDCLTPSDTAALSAVQYNGDNRAFIETSYDHLDRPISISTPGDEWEGHVKQTIYRVNDTLEVKRYSPSNLTGNEYYPPRQLSCEESVDEDGQRVWVFTDFIGRTILERRGSGGETSDTYYVYNGLSQLCYVLQPMYQDNPSLSLYAYQYVYDNHGRIVSRTLPGCSPIIYEYDNADRVIRMQDGNLRSHQKYRVFTYDSLGRLTTQAIEGGATELINYYDNYDFLNVYDSLNMDSDDGPVLGLQWYISNAKYGKGNLTGTWQTASDGSHLLSSFVYDSRGRVVRQAENYPGTTALVTEYSYNFTDDVTQEYFTHYCQDTDLGMLTTDFWGRLENRYDYGGTRLLSSSVISMYDAVRGVMLNDTINRLTYDDYGHLLSNDRKGSNGDLTYAYDTIHGWLTGISSTSGFEQKLYRASVGSIPRWNGSISAMTWKTDANAMHRYDYTYDSQNRLTEAHYSNYGHAQGNPNSPLSLIPASSSVPDFSTAYEYDRNCNPIWIERYGRMNDGTYDIIDDVDIAYSGNRMASATDYASETLSYYGSSDFVDGASTSVEYAYDQNGALTMDLNRGIESIDYDLAGNPRQINFSNNRTTSYVYSADGRRLSTKHYQQGHINETTAYVGRFQFRNGIIDRFDFPGGFFDFDWIDGVYTCRYYIQDYLGSIRMVMNRDGIRRPEQITHYYPYGGVIGGISTNGTWQNNKFEGKELDRTFGLDNYDIHARQYFAMMPSWDRIDPLAEDNPQFSPYSYCMGNSVNFGDYNGMNPIFDENGIYLGDTKEGFTGEILVFKGMNFDINKANEMTVEELLDIYNPDFSVSLGIFWLKPSGLENVWNTILEHFDGEPLDDNIRFSVAHLGRVKYDLDKTSGSKGGGDYAGWKTYPDGNTYGSSGYPYETTVENIAAALLLHEYYGHTVKKWGDSQNNHYKCYEAIKKFRLYDKTTKSFKDKTEEGINKR